MLSGIRIWGSCWKVSRADSNCCELACLCWGQLNGSFRFQVRTWLFCPRLAAAWVLFPFAVLTVPIAHSVICAPDFHSSLLFRRLTRRLNSKVQEKSFACERNLHTRGFALNYCETSGYNTGHGSFSEPSCLVLQPEGHIFSTESEISRRNQRERDIKTKWETGTGVGLQWTSKEADSGMWPLALAFEAFS